MTGACGICGGGMQPTGRTTVDSRPTYRHEGRSTATRFELLGGPRGELAALPVGDCRRHDRYRRFVTLAEVGRPMTPALVERAKGWALRSAAAS